MTSVNYILNNRTLKLESDSEDYLLLNNTKAFWFHPKKDSRFKGFFIKNKDSMLKFIHDFVHPENSEVKGIIHKAYSVGIETENYKDYFFIPDDSNSLVFRTTEKAFKVILDVKDIFDNREFGRNYSISFNENKTIIHFQKRTSYKDNDKTDNEKEFDAYLVFNSLIKPNKEWVKISLNYDKERHSPPFERYMYIPGEFNTQELIITAGTNLKDAIDENRAVESALIEDIAWSDNELKRIIKWKIAPLDINFAYNLSRYYLSKLATDKGLIAGLPWFFQQWTRDELISLPAVLKLKHPHYIKDRVIELLNHIDYDGRLPSILNKRIKNQDSIGWLFRFFYELTTKYRNTFRKKEYVKAVKKLEVSGYNLLKYFLRDNLLYNKEYETWMDSIPREGFRIEIQALANEILELMKLLTNDLHYARIQSRLVNNIRDKFFDGSLYDSINDKTIRNNVFLSYYISPQILTTSQWKSAFLRALKSLWLNWGGLSSLQKDSKDFHEWHTGENPESYHQGDSWFFINNIAALSFHRLMIFRDYADKIMDASTDACLLKGCLGCLPELSSASKLRAEGSPLQAWSLATYIELVDEVFR